MIEGLKIAIITAVYVPEPVVSARMAVDLATYLAKQGAQVTVVCPQPSRPSSGDYGIYIKSGAQIVTQEGAVKVVRLPSFSAPQSKIFARFRESYSFGNYVSRYLDALVEKPDVLYVNAWPLFGQALIARCAKKCGIPFVLQIMDIYPESLLHRVPAFLGQFLGPLLTNIDRWIARQATLVSVISDNMRSTYVDNRKIPANKVVTINLWQDEGMFDVFPLKEVACAKYGIPDNKFTFLYLGNIGPVAGVDFLIRAFNNAGLESAQLLIVGDGSAKDSCMQQVALLSAGNILFISDPDVSNVPLLQCMADICLLPMKRGTGMSSIPSKLPAYMFSAKPILATMEESSDTAKVIRDSSCGWIGDSEDLIWLSDKMREVATLKPSERDEFGQNGRQYGLVNFSKSLGVRHLAELVISAKHP